MKDVMRTAEERPWLMSQVFLLLLECSSLFAECLRLFKAPGQSWGLITDHLFTYGETKALRRHALCCFPCCHDKIFDGNSLQEEGFALSHGSGISAHQSWEAMGKKFTVAKCVGRLLCYGNSERRLQARTRRCGLQSPAP